MTATAAPASSPSRARSSARLGGSLRSILLDPRGGFDAAIRAAERRARGDKRLAEGAAPYVLGALGGASLMALWLKIGGLAGVRDVSAAEFRWDFLIASLVAGGLGALVLQWVWGAAGSRLAHLIGGRPRPRDLRLVWGGSDLPLALAFVVLLPLDLLVVGPETFTTERLTDALSTTWAATSIALSVSVSVWSLYLFVRGTAVAASFSMARAAATIALFVVFLAALVGLVAGIAMVAG